MPTSFPCQAAMRTFGDGSQPSGGVNLRTGAKGIKGDVKPVPDRNQLVFVF
jgi:hypothetical protein